MVKSEVTSLITHASKAWTWLTCGNFIQSRPKILSTLARGHDCNFGRYKPQIILSLTHSSVSLGCDVQCVRLLFQREQWIISRVHCSPLGSGGSAGEHAVVAEAATRVHNFHPNGIISSARAALLQIPIRGEETHAESHGDHLHLQSVPFVPLYCKREKPKRLAADALLATPFCSNCIARLIFPDISIFSLTGSIFRIKGPLLA
jgi:hypothetical protein